MKEIYSKIEPSLLLHTIVGLHDFNERVTVITNPSNFLQSIAINLNKDHKTKAHRHNEINTVYVKKQQQEAWIVLSGMVEITLYDIDDTIIDSTILVEKDMLITFSGGHSLTALEDNSIILEFKLGPYLGQESDKTFINQ